MLNICFPYLGLSFKLYLLLNSSYIERDMFPYVRHHITADLCVFGFWILLFVIQKMTIGVHNLIQCNVANQYRGCPTGVEPTTEVDPSSVRYGHPVLTLYPTVVLHGKNWSVSVKV